VTAFARVLGVTPERGTKPSMLMALPHVPRPKEGAEDALAAVTPDAASARASSN